MIPFGQTHLRNFSSMSKETQLAPKMEQLLLQAEPSRGGRICTKPWPWCFHNWGSRDCCFGGDVPSLSVEDEEVTEGDDSEDEEVSTISFVLFLGVGTIW